MNTIIFSRDLVKIATDGYRQHGALYPPPHQQWSGDSAVVEFAARGEFTCYIPEHKL